MEDSFCDFDTKIKELKSLCFIDDDIISQLKAIDDAIAELKYNLDMGNTINNAIVKLKYNGYVEPYDIFLTKEFGNIVAKFILNLIAYNSHMERDYMQLFLDLNKPDDNTIMYFSHIVYRIYLNHHDKLYNLKSSEIYINNNYIDKLFNLTHNENHSYTIDDTIFRLIHTGYNINPILEINYIEKIDLGEGLQLTQIKNNETETYRNASVTLILHEIMKTISIKYSKNKSGKFSKV